MPTRSAALLVALLLAVARPTLSQEKEKKPKDEMTPKAAQADAGPLDTLVVPQAYKARAIGPAVMGGRVSVIAFDPRDPYTFYVGLGTRIRIVPSVFVVAEVSPRLSGYVGGDAEFAFALEKRVGAHVFSLTFANTSATTYGQIARGGNPESLYLGFNLARKFY